MKFFKKGVSALLTAGIAVTMLFSGGVTAGAAKASEAEKAAAPTYKVIYTPTESVNEKNTAYTFDNEEVKGYDQCVITGISKEECDWILKNYDSRGFIVGITFGAPLSDEYISYNHFSYRMGMRDSALKASDGIGGSKILTACAADWEEGKVGFIIDPNKISRKAREKLKEIKTCSVSIEMLNYNSIKYSSFSSQKELPASEFKAPNVQSRFIYNDGSTDPESEEAVTKEISFLTDFSVKDSTYTGKARTPDVTIKDGEKVLEQGKDYTLAYRNNENVGLATVTVTGKGDYSGTKELFFRIVPKLTAKRSGNKITLSWKGSLWQGAIHYREKGEKKYKLLTTFSDEKMEKTSYSTSKLDKNKTYQFRISSYSNVTSTVNGVTTKSKNFEGYSNTVTVK